MKKIILLILFVCLLGIVALILNTFSISSFFCAKKPEPLEAIYNCISKGGKWGSFGMSRECRCNNKTKDANRPCSTWGDCEGLCLAPENAKEGGEVVGKCSKYDLMPGCRSIVEDGKAVGICLD